MTTNNHSDDENEDEEDDDDDDADDADDPNPMSWRSKPARNFHCNVCRNSHSCH